MRLPAMSAMEATTEQRLFGALADISARLKSLEQIYKDIKNDLSNVSQAVGKVQNFVDKTTALHEMKIAELEKTVTEYDRRYADLAGDFETHKNEQAKKEMEQAVFNERFRTVRSIFIAGISIFATLLAGFLWQMFVGGGLGALTK